ncbi:MAG: hypothetical protein LBR64_05325 [Dysgonamonadaceae bacterium]|jgi:hypothetical protein|nr:hypothetical protein [Dysgonamonadaceae bacterium]
MKNCLNILDRQLISHSESATLGLSSGKTGVCIYFYCQSRLIGNREYESAAGKLLDEIFEKIDTVGYYDVKSGLAGIGLGVDYLIDNKFVAGDINTVLKAVDDKIFRQTAYYSDNEMINPETLIHLLYYFCVRLQKLNSGSEQQYLVKELTISIINELSKQPIREIFEEPLFFTTDYLLPQYLFVLSKIAGIGFYNYKIIKILQELSVFLLSQIPLLHSNRLYLLWAMDAVNRQIETKNWNKHIAMLRRELDVNEIINGECRSRNIYFNDGLTAIFLLLSALSDYFTANELSGYKQAIINKIQTSPEWERLAEDSEYFATRCGLYDGYCGTSLLLNCYERELK